MDKKRLMLIGAGVCALAALAGVAYIIVRKGAVTGAVAFVPAVAAALLYSYSRSDGENKKGK